MGSTLVQQGLQLQLHQFLPGFLLCTFNRITRETEYRYKCLLFEGNSFSSPFFSNMAHQVLVKACVSWEGQVGRRKNVCPAEIKMSLKVVSCRRQSCQCFLWQRSTMQAFDVSFCPTAHLFLRTRQDKYHPLMCVMYGWKHPQLRSGTGTFIVFGLIQSHTEWEHSIWRFSINLTPVENS